MSSSTWDVRSLIVQALLKDLRKRSNLTQAELADRLNKPQSYVSKYESGERRLDVIELRDVCLQCGCTLEEFSKILEKKLR